MNIEVGRKYRRVRINNHSDNGMTFIGQGITVRKIDGDDVWFSKTSKSGFVDNHCVQVINRFRMNFKPVVTSLENK